MRAWPSCANGHPPVPMLQMLNHDAFRCLECGNMNTTRDLYNKWGGLLRGVSS